MDYKLPQTNLKWLQDQTIFLTKAGSHAYGMNTPTSDLDLRGFAVAPKQYYTGFVNRFEQAEFKGDPDIVVFDVRKWFKLAAEANPNVIEQVFTAPADWLHSTPASDLIVENRDLFISKRAKHTFSGYALAQLKRIEGHRAWLLSPPKGEPTRIEFDLVENPEINKTRRDVAMAAIRKKLESWEVDMGEVSEAGKVALKDQIAASLAEQGILQSNQWVNAGKAIGLSDIFIEILEKENAFNNAMNHWKQYLNWKANRNPKRAEMENTIGYDTKHGAHLVRLLRMGKEILTTGQCIVKRPDAEELLAIKNGAWSYDRLISYAKKTEAELNLLYDTSKLPKTPDFNKLDDLCQKVTELSL